MLFILLLLAADPPPLPKLVLDSFPPQARAAIAAADRRARARPDDAAAVGGLAVVLHAWDQFDAAHAAYARARHLAPHTAEWTYLDGVVLQRLGRHADAAERFAAVLRAQSDYLPARVKLAEALLDAGDVDRSAPLFSALAQEPAAAAPAALGLGRIAALAGRHADAVAEFERAIALFPEFGAAYYGLAMSQRSLGRRKEAAAALDRHRQYGVRWPAIDDPMLRKIADLKKDDDRVLLQKALRLADEGDVPGAIAAHEAALARDPSIPQAHANLITLYGRARNWKKAEEHYRQVLALGFNRDEAHYNYGVLLGLQARWADAEAAYREAIAVNPWHAPARNNLGLILQQQGKIDEAAEAYRRAIEAQPGFRLARFNLARILIGQGRNDEAIAELEKILEPRDAETARYLFALATAHVRAGRRDTGLRLAADARDLALKFGQKDLAAAIDRDLRALGAK